MYANKVGAIGAGYIAEALATQTNLKRLSIDLYFNNVTEIGTDSICRSIQ